MSAAGSDDWMQSSDDQVKRQLSPDSVLAQFRNTGVLTRDPGLGYSPMEGTGSGGSV